LIDAASYGWIYKFIHDYDDEADHPPPPGDSWLQPHTADPRKLSEFFGRVAIRVRETPGQPYATELRDYYIEMANERELKRLSH